MGCHVKYAWRLLQESAGATLTVGEIQLEGSCEVVDPEVKTFSCIPDPLQHA